MERTPAAGGSRGVSQYGPIAVETREFRRPVTPVAHPKAKLLLVRDGEATITHGERAFHTQPGDFMLVRPNAACGGSPEPIATISTIYAEPEFVFDKWRWQLSPFFPSSESVHALGRVYAKVIRARLPEPEAAVVAELYDELHAVLADGFDGFHLADAVFARLLAIVTPHLRDESVPLTGTLRSPLHQSTTPPRKEVAAVLARLHADLAAHWTVDALANEVHISSRQLQRLFEETLHESFSDHLTRLRVEEMARLLRETDDTVAVVAARVGWSRGHAVEKFRGFFTITPAQYRGAVRDHDIHVVDHDRFPEQ